MGGEVEMCIFFCIWIETRRKNHPRGPYNKKTAFLLCYLLRALHWNIYACCIANIQNCINAKLTFFFFKNGHKNICQATRSSSNVTVTHLPSKGRVPLPFPLNLGALKLWQKWGYKTSKATSQKARQMFFFLSRPYSLEHHWEDGTEISHKPPAFTPASLFYCQYPPSRMVCLSQLMNLCYWLQAHFAQHMTGQWMNHRQMEKMVEMVSKITILWGLDASFFYRT